jgi:hypothetical protein
MILWRRTRVGEKSQYLVKYKNYSYLQCEWIDEDEVQLI